MDADFSPSSRELAQQGPRLAGVWADFDPAAGGTVTQEISAVSPTQLNITFENVPEFGQTNANTFQWQIDVASGQISIVYQSLALIGGPIVSGYSEGGLTNAPPSVDLSTSVTTTGGNELKLRAQAGSRPTQPSTFMMEVSGLTAPTALFQILGFGLTRAGVPLDALGLGGCRSYVSQDSVSFVFAAANPTVLSLAVPATPNFIGIELGVQAAAQEAGANLLGFTTSNGLYVRIGQ